MRASILQRVRDSETSFKRIEGIVGLSAILGPDGLPTMNIGETPGVFMALESQAAGPLHSRPNLITQTRTPRWVFYIVTRSVNDASGQLNADQVDTLSNELDDALIGFKPVGACTQLKKSSAAGRTIKWALDYHFYASYYEASDTWRKKP